MVRRLIAERSGGVAVFVALCLPVIIGMASLGVEVSMWLLTQRSLQGAADAAAISAAFANTSLTTMRNQANAVAAQNGYTNGVNGVTVLVNNPPSQGNYTTNTQAIEVIIKQTQTRLLSVLFLNANPTVAARAVVAPPTSGTCILARNATASGAVQLDFLAALTSSKCAVTVNSTSSSALTLAFFAAIAGPVYDRGGWQTFLASLNGSPTIQNDTSLPPINTLDPYSSTVLGTVPACDSKQKITGKTTYNLTPAHFCSGWNFSAATVNLAAGTYYIDSQFNLSGLVALNGTAGVTLVLNGNYTISAGNLAQFNINAPTTGNFAGLAIVDLSTTATTQAFQNGVLMNINGAIYFPHQQLQFANGWVDTGCTQVIADTIELNAVSISIEPSSCNLTGSGGPTTALLME